MHSKLADAARHDLLDRVRRLTPGERLEAFLRHSRSVAELARAACRGRTAQTRP